tara:strand:- start:4924 stop:5511 length:588 start_codon:yes stop_codon:yes gene_type:complete
MELAEAINQIDRNELINQVVLSWFPELKTKIIDSDEDALDKYRDYLRKFSSQKAIDKITKKLIEFEKFVFNIHEFTNKLEGVYYQSSVYYLEIVEDLKSAKQFLKMSLEKEIEFLEKELIRPLKIKWLGSSGQLGEVFHKLYENGYIHSSKTNLIDWIQEAIDHDGKRVTINDVIMGGEANYRKQTVIEKIKRKG